jgi:hypothetical protein
VMKAGEGGSGDGIGAVEDKPAAVNLEKV